jgi:KUP system potassium uptake protein
MYWPGIIISVLAAAVASQAIITGTFQLISQIMNLSYFPKVKLVYTSARFHGQIYIPLANWLLMIGTVVVAVVFKNVSVSRFDRTSLSSQDFHSSSENTLELTLSVPQTTKLGRAYGTCVALIVFITTCMVSIVAIICWIRIHPLIVLAGFLIFASLDGLYLSSALTKVPDGSWFTLMLAVVLSSVIFVWRYGKEQQWKAESSDSVALSQLVIPGESGKLCLSTADGGGELTEIRGKSSRGTREFWRPEQVDICAGVGIFFDKAGDMPPKIYARFLRRFQARHQLTIFFHLHSLPKPKVCCLILLAGDAFITLLVTNASPIQVDAEELYSIDRVSLPNFFRIHVRQGFNDQVMRQDLGRIMFDRLHDFLIRTTGHDAAAGTSGSLHDQSEISAREIDTLVAAFQSQVVYIVGKEQLRVASTTSLFRKLVLKAFIWLRGLSGSKIAEMDIPIDYLFEVGIVKEI